MLNRTANLFLSLSTATAVTVLLYGQEQRQPVASASASVGTRANTSAAANAAPGQVIDWELELLDPNVGCVPVAGKATSSYSRINAVSFLRFERQQERDAGHHHHRTQAGAPPV
jgi:hypothetical protein